MMGLTLLEVRCEKKHNNLLLRDLTDVLKTIPFPQKIASGACFRRTFSDKCSITVKKLEEMAKQKYEVKRVQDQCLRWVTQKYKLLEALDPCFMLVFDSGQRPNFHEKDRAKLKADRRWEMCQLDLNSMFEDEITLMTKETKLHSKWESCSEVDS